MNRRVSALVVLVICALSFSIPVAFAASAAGIGIPGTNLLSNPGFENGLNSWHFTPGTGVYTVDSLSHSGSYSAKGVETSARNVGRLYQDVTGAAVPGNEFQISGWIKTSNVTGSVVIGLDYITQGDYTAAGGYVIEIGHASGTSDWAFYQSPVFTLQPMPSNASALYFLFDFNMGGGTAWLDDLSLVAVSAAPTIVPSGTSSTPQPTYTGSFTFKGWIDGTDYLFMQGGGGAVWYQHTKSEIPGYEINGAGVQGNVQRHQNLPTYIDGDAWYPTWAGITSSWIDVPSVSNEYISPMPHPTGEWNITSITNVVARGNFSVLEYPSASNNYTAKILVDDILPSGADWYSFTMNWIANSPLTQSTSDVTKTAWVPPPANGAAAGIVTAGAVSVVALLAAAASSVPAAATTGFLDKLVSEIRKLLPDTVKKWMEDFISSKRKLKIDEKTGSPYLPTKPEIIVYSIAIILLTLSFSYVKVSTLNDLLIVLPAFFATSILVALVRTYVLTLYARKRGVWTEYKLWYFGVAMFLLSTLAFKAPFSSPTRSVHHSRNFTDRLGGFLSTAGLLITLAFGGFFFILLRGGLVLIGGTGLAMCIISAFFDTFPIEPMGGKDIYTYNKTLWAGLFLASLALYVAWLANVL